MVVVLVVAHVAAAMLVVSGISKLRAPESTRPLLAIIADRLGAEAPPLRRLMRHPVAGRVLGCVEVMLGIGCLAGSRVTAFGAAVAYVLFAELLLAARTRGVESCGCFGETHTPPSVGHVIANLASAIAVFVAALGHEMPAAWAAVDGGALVDVAYLVALGAATALAIALESVVVEVSQRRRLLAAEPPAPRPRGAIS